MRAITPLRKMVGAAAAAAIGEALDLDNAKGGGAVLTALRFVQRVVQPPAVSNSGILFLTGTAGDADVQRNGAVFRVWFKCLDWNLRRRLVHSKSPSMDGHHAWR
jgi:hypothetical protein